MAAFSKRELREARCGDDLVADVSGLNVRRLQNSGESSVMVRGRSKPSPWITALALGCVTKADRCP